MARRDFPGEPGSGGGNPDPPPRPKPKGSTPTAPPAGPSSPYTSVAQARPLPVLWGTDKVLAYIIEKLPTVARQPGAWINGEAVQRGAIRSANGNVYKVLKGGTGSSAPSGSGADPVARANTTAYAFLDVRSSNGNAYQVRTNGTSNGSGTAPAGPGDDIIDGGVHWSFLQALPFSILTTADGIVWQNLGSLPYPLYAQFFVAALCEGEILDILTVYWEKQRLHTTNGPFLGNNLTFVKGVDAANQVLNATWDSSGYQHTAVVLTDFIYGAETGTQKEIPSLAFEVKGPLAPSTLDPNPADWLVDLLTHNRRGAGWASGKVDSATVTGAGAATFRTYTDAAGIRFSYYLDTQRTGLEMVQDGMIATNSDAYWSSGVLKVVPLSDTSITSPVFGAVNYVPANIAAYNLTVDDFLDKGQPVQMVRAPDADCFNCWPVEYKDRGAGYVTVTVEDPDQTDIEKRGGLFRAGTVSLPFTFPDGTAPVMLSRIFAQRSLNGRNTYTFRLSWKYIALEPTSIVTLTDTYLGLVLTPVRIVRLRENEDRSITFTAEDYPEGVAAPGVQYAPQKNDGYPENQVTTAQSITLGTDIGVPNSTVPNSSTTRGGGVDNIFPNPTSEDNPPPGADLTKAEWVGRVNLGIGTAPAGAWVRSPGTGTGLAIDFEAPALPGETYYLEAQAAAASAGANKGGFVKITSLDSTGASLGSASGTENDLATFALSSVSFVMPSGATRVRFSLVNGSDASAHAYFDTILARRAVDLKLFAVEPWVARRYLAFCSVFVNAAGTAASYANTGEAFGFDRFTAPSLVQVGAEPAKRLRLRLAALPNSQSLSNMKKFAWAHRSQAVNANIGSPSTQLILKGWNLGTGDFDFWPGYDDWSLQAGGVNQVTYQYPYPWASIDGTNGSVWDVLVAIGADFPFAFF